MEQSALRFAPASNFAIAIRRRVSQEFEASGDSPFANWAVWLLGACYAATGALAYALILAGGLDIGGNLAIAVLGGVCAFMIMATMGHSAAHGTLSSRRWLNNLVVFLTFAVVGISGALWRDRHVRLHHQLPNLPGTGVDADGSALLRLSPHKPWHPIHALQPLYGPILYMLGVLHMAWFEDFLYLAAVRRAGLAQFRTWPAFAEFAATKLLHTILLIVIPALVLRTPIWGLICTYVSAMAVSSVTFLALTIGIHISDLAEFPLPDSDGQLMHDWATHQVLTSVDWKPMSPLIIALVGGANADVAHHLFPQFSHRHAALLSRIIAEEAATCGVRYRKTSLARLLRGHWRQLMRLSRPDGMGTPRPRAQRGPSAQAWAEDA